jgi:hypothetical protein
MDKESLEKLLSEGLSLDEIGKRCGKSGATIAFWVKKHGLEASGREKHAAKGGIERGLNGGSHALDKLREEAKKCVLLCATCHAEVEGGAATLPVECGPDSRIPIHQHPANPG